MNSCHGHMHRKMTMLIVVRTVKYHRSGESIWPFWWKAGCPFQKAFGNALVPQSDHSDGEGLDVGNVEHLKHVGTVDPMSPALKTSSNLNYPYYFTNKEVQLDNLKKKRLDPSHLMASLIPIFPSQEIIQVKTPAVELLGPVTDRVLGLDSVDIIGTVQILTKFQGLLWINWTKATFGSRLLSCLAACFTKIDRDKLRGHLCDQKPCNIFDAWPITDYQPW